MWAIFILLLVHYITIKTAHKAFCIRWMCTSITYSQIASFEAHNILLLHLLKLINWNRRQKKKHAHTRTKTQIILSCCTSNGNNKFQPIDTNDVICLQYIHPIGSAWLGLASLIIINLFGPLNSFIPLFDSSCPFDDSNLYSPKMLILFIDSLSLSSLSFVTLINLFLVFLVFSYYNPSYFIGNSNKRWILYFRAIESKPEWLKLYAKIRHILNIYK